MDLILWRHAEAEDGDNDLQRRLTLRGEKQARTMAKWLIAHAPKELEVLSSPAKRCEQTAKALGLPFRTDNNLLPEASATRLLADSGWPQRENSVLLIGHQPALGRLASLLLTGSEDDWGMKKAAIWWFHNRKRGERQQTVLLKVVISPDLLEMD